MTRYGARLIGLRGLILSFVLLSVFATLCNSFIVAYRVQRDVLIQSALEANGAYAAKVASSIGAFLRSAQGRLMHSADVLAERWDDPLALREEIERLHSQETDFDSIAILDTNGKIVQIAPEMWHLQGRAVSSEQMKRTLKSRQPIVSSAYVSLSGNLVVFISQPIVNSSGDLLGTVGGSVYLRRQSALSTVISNHFHHGGTFVFVADSSRRLLYHPESDRIGEVLDYSKTVDAALRGETGSMETQNYRGTLMLAGFAQVPDAHWAVVAQQPRQRALEILQPLMLDMAIGVIPAGLIGLASILAGTALITRPLRQLSSAAKQLAAPETPAALHRVHAWYRDAATIRQALLTGVQLLQQKLGRLSYEAQSDALTDLANRRAMQELLDIVEKDDQTFAVLAMDIDHFKHVNDTFGHDAGDVALKQIADIIRRNSRAGDLACRAGGEEFVLIMPGASLDIARRTAERIRECVGSTPVPGVGSLTISIGVACRDDIASTSAAVLKTADERLYEAKRTGRDRVVAGTSMARS